MLADYYGILHIKMTDVDEETQEIFGCFFPTSDDPDSPPPPPTRLSDKLEAALGRPWLRKNICMYKGYVLDGYPRSYESMNQLLMRDKPGAEDADPDAEPEKELAEDICPEFIVVL